MRVDPDTSIHDLTDAEAVDLRAWCDAVTFGGVVPHDGGMLMLQWIDQHGGTSDRPVHAFLVRALHALLRRADAPSALAKFSEPDLHAELARRAHARKQKLFGRAP